MLIKDIKIFLKKRKAKSVSMLMNDIGIFPGEEKRKKRQYRYERYKNLPEEE